MGTVADLRSDSVAFVYFYFMGDEPTRVRAVAPAHAAYWKQLRLRNFRGGPFADRSGGLITFAAHSEDEAERYVAGDPFVRQGLLEKRYLKWWCID
jgi:uncharacterized protein YciI